MKPGSHILLIDCGDRKGIVHQVTGVLYRRGLNIEEQGEFVDHLAEHFFMRTAVTGDIDPASLMSELRQAVPADARLRLEESRPKKIVVLASKEPHCVGDLLMRHHYGELNAEISAVISNHPDLEDLTRRFSLPFCCLSHEDRSRAEHEAGIQAVLQDYQPEYIVLAKYMRVLGREFVDFYPGRIINIHHSFLPAFAGSKPYHQAYERGVKIIGATAHFVTAGLDQGPIIAQDVISIDHSKGPAQLIQAGRDVEKTVLAKALRLVFEERVFVHQNRTIIFD